MRLMSYFSNNTHVPVTSPSVQSDHLKTVTLRVVGQEIQQLRKMRKLSGHEFGRLLQVSQQQISRYERGNNLITFDVLFRLLFALDVDPKTFFDRVSEQISQQCQKDKTPPPVSVL